MKVVVIDYFHIWLANSEANTLSPIMKKRARRRISQIEWSIKVTFS